MAEIVSSTLEQSNVTSQAGSSMELQLNDGLMETDEESPLGGNQEGKAHQYIDENVEDFEESPLILQPGVMVDQPGLMSPLVGSMLMPMGNIQSKGLPSNGVLSNGGVSPPPLQSDELKAALMQQVEYYFSKDNLATDKYLLSQMDGDNFVPVTIVASFNQVKRLTTDLDMILEVVKESPLLQLDEQGDKIRAIPEKRCILILREIPQDTPQQEIMALFSGGKCPSFLSCEFAENSCWYVTFESEDDAQKAFSFLREEVRTFLGQPIRARIKGTTVQRSSGIPKKPRVNYPVQPMTRLQYYPQQPGGVLPWTSPPNTTPTSNYFDRGNFYIPANGYVPSPYGPPGRFQAYPQQVNGGRNIPPDMSERGRGHPGGRGRGDQPFSPLMNGSDSFTDRDRGSDRSGRPRGEHSRDHYRSSDRQRYSREDNIQKIPRLSKNKRPTSSGSGPPREAERSTNDQRQPRSQQSLDLAPVNFPPLPTSEAGGTSPPSVTPTQLSESSDIKNVSNLADIVKGRKLKDNAPPLTTTNHPPLPSTVTTSNTLNPEPDVTITHTADSNQGTIPQEAETPKPVITNTSQSSSGSTTVSSAPNHTQPPSAAAIVASNIPYTPRTVNHSTGQTVVSTAVSSASTSVTTAASVVASGGQSTVTTTSTVSAGSSNSGGRPYQSKGSRGDFKGPHRGEKGYYSSSGKQGAARHNDRDNAQNRQNGARNSQVSKEGRQAPPNNRRNRDRDRDRKNGSNFRNGPPRPSPKPLKKHQLLQAPPPPPTPTNEPKEPTSTKPGVEKMDDSKLQSNKKSDKLSYAQMAQRKKAPPSPVPPPPAALKQDLQAEDAEPPIKSSSAPASPKGERKNNNTPTEHCLAQGKQQAKNTVQNNDGKSVLSAPLKPAVSKSAPTSPCKEAVSVTGSPLPHRPKDD